MVTTTVTVMVTRVEDQTSSLAITETEVINQTTNKTLVSEVTIKGIPTTKVTKATKVVKFIKEATKATTATTAMAVVVTTKISLLLLQRDITRIVGTVLREWVFSIRKRSRFECNSFLSYNTQKYT